MENKNSNISRTYNIKLGNSNINNKNYIVINKKDLCDKSSSKRHSWWPYDLFGLRSTNYLGSNCHFELDYFSNVDQPFAPTTVNAPAHVCEELLKLHGVDFHDNPLVTEMSKYPLEQSNNYFQLPLQSPINSAGYT